MTFKEFLALHAQVDLPALLLFLGNIFFLVVLSKWHVDDGKFDFRTALLDSSSGTISFSRLGNLTALFISTEIILYEAIKGRMSEWLFSGYLLAWTGTYIASKWSPQTAPPLPPRYEGSGNQKPQ